MRSARRSPEQVEADQHDHDARLAAAIEQALGHVDDDEFNLRLLGPIAARAGIPERTLKQLARMGRFCPVYEMSQRLHFVLASELRDFLQRVKISPDSAPDPNDLDLRPAEPFAHLRGKKPAPTAAQCGDRSRRSARTAPDRSDAPACRRGGRA